MPGVTAIAVPYFCSLPAAPPPWPGVVVVMAVVVFLAGLLVGVIVAGTVLLRREGRTGGRASSRLGMYARRLHGLGR